MKLRRIQLQTAALLVVLLGHRSLGAEDDGLARQATIAIRKAATFYREQLSSHGGYVYFYSIDLKQRWGEGVATNDQVWVQPPGTPTVGLALLKAYEATQDKMYLEAATAAAEALVYGQVKSGGWTNCIDFDPQGARVAQYRNGKGRGRNTSSLDDGQTQSAIQLLIHVDRAHAFEHKQIHDAAQVALNALLKAQFPNGAFPQVWDDDILPDPPIARASFPPYDWRTEGRIKNYWDMYTLNDNVTGYVAATLIDAYAIYRDERYVDALKRLGDFLILAQLPDPQPGWAQQYNYEMRPIWARKFEPPAVASDETQEVLHTLTSIYLATGDKKYLEPIPRALTWLKHSQLADGRLARYYELKTNRPLYMIRRGDNYTLTHDDTDLPAHYGWKIESRIQEQEKRFAGVQSGKRPLDPKTEPTDEEIRAIIASLDDQGRWVCTYGGERLVGQAKMAVGAKYLSSELTSRNLTLLSEFLLDATNKPKSR